MRHCLLSTPRLPGCRQGSNVLNRSMQGLWSTHRRTKLNLNAPATPAGPPGTSSTPNETGPQQSTTQEDPSSEPTAPNPDLGLVSEGANAGKRKVRSSRALDSGNKRTKLSSASGGAISKEHTPPTARLSDLGGIEACIEKVLELVAMPLCHPEVYIHTGVQPPRGVLLHGPPGCGKTLLANAIAGVCCQGLSIIRNQLIFMDQELGIPFINISAPSIVSGMSGESEKTLRDTFDEAKVLQITLSILHHLTPL